MNRIRIFLAALSIAMAGAIVAAQTNVPNVLVAGQTIKAGPLNTNFSTIYNAALNRLTGGLISGNIQVDPGITIDGIDLSTAVCATCDATFKNLILGTPSTGITVNGVNIVNSTGKIPALTATYFTSLSFDSANLTGTAGAINGSAITNLNATNLATGTVAPTRLAATGASGTAVLQGDSTWVELNDVTAKVALYTATTADHIITANGTFTITLYACTGNNKRKIDIKNIGATTVTIAASGAETIDGAATQTLPTQYQSYTLVCNNTNNWIII